MASIWRQLQGSVYITTHRLHRLGLQCIYQMVVLGWGLLLDHLEMLYARGAHIIQHCSTMCIQSSIKKHAPWTMRIVSLMWFSQWCLNPMRGTPPCSFIVPIVQNNIYIYCTRTGIERILLRPLNEISTYVKI